MRVIIQPHVVTALAALSIFVGCTEDGTHVSYDNIPWRTDFNQAKDEATAQNKPLVIVFTASWCGPCQLMNKKSWPDPRVEQVATDNYVPVMLDVDTPPNDKIADQYQVQGFPTVIVADGEGTPSKSAHFLSADDLHAFLTTN